MTLHKGSIGAQIGAESTDLVLLIMNDRGIERLLQDQVTLGGEASIAAGPVGRSGTAETDVQLGAEMLSYSRARPLRWDRSVGWSRPSGSRRESPVLWSPGGIP
jgi:lipid-binding SYLF domain-containing protein